MTPDPLLLVLAIAAVVAGWLWFRYRDGPSRRAEARLNRICLGNQGQADRLISAEITRSPGISRAEAAARAVERYERDNR